MTLSTDGQRQILAAELNDDPLSRDYASMVTEASVLTDLTTSYRTRNKTVMTGDEIFQQTDLSEFVALADGASSTTDTQGHWIAFCGRDEVDPFATANVQFVTSIFSSGSNTVSNLASARVESITRLEELGLPVPTLGQIATARS